MRGRDCDSYDTFRCTNHTLATIFAYAVIGYVPNNENPIQYSFKTSNLHFTLERQEQTHSALHKHFMSIHWHRIEPGPPILFK